MERERERQATLGRQVTAETYRRLARARRLMDECYQLPLDLEQVSREACLSRFHFLRLFRRAFNKTPHQYLIHRRIERAKELLSSSRLTVTEVCLEVGFESLGSFSSLFHKHVGHPPVAYRAIVSEKRHEVRRKIPACALMLYGMKSSAPAQISNFREASSL
jgi:AraC-like DNA-binding protein